MAIAAHANRVKTYVIWLVILSVLAFAGWQAYHVAMDQQTARIPLTVRNATFDVKVVDSDPARQHGLSGTRELAKTEGMLFVFDTEYTWGIWMKDMFISIDILWLNNDKRVIHIVKNAEPSSYPETTYRPDKPAKYVLELPAGSVEQKNIQVGDTVTFNLADVAKGGAE